MVDGLSSLVRYLALMTTIQLPRNVQFLYEEHLARLEFEALGCHDLVRAGDHWDRMTGTVNGTAEDDAGAVRVPGRARWAAVDLRDLDDARAIKVDGSTGRDRSIST